MGIFFDQDWFDDRLKSAGLTQAAMAQAAGMTIDDIDLFVPHQANLRIINSSAEKLGLPEEKVFVNVHKYGNTSGGSIPLALYEAEKEGRLKKGDAVQVELLPLALGATTSFSEILLVSSGSGEANEGEVWTFVHAVGGGALTWRAAHRLKAPAGLEWEVFGWGLTAATTAAGEVMLGIGSFYRCRGYVVVLP